MLYIGTKIVVIGSNVKRKAGPRIGSVGFIVRISEKMNRLHDLFVCDAQILFTQYGFQKRQRCELKNVVIALPNFEKLSLSVVDVINKALKDTKTSILRKKSVLMVSPADALFENDLCYKVHSYLLNHEINYKLFKIVHLQNSKEFPNTERLHNALSKVAKNFLLKCTSNRDFTALKHNVTTISEKDTSIFKEVLELILKLNVLEERNKQKDYRRAPKIEIVIFNSLFKPYEFKQCFIERSKYVPLAFFEFCANISNHLSIKGSKVVSKHV